MLIVDDEPLMREGLSRMPWEKIGIHLTGAVSNGMDALTLIREQSVQILFTDIQMPEISGLELIRAALIINPSIRSVILTGHSRFEYAQKAIALRVYDYILKPCDPENVLTIIGNLVSEIQRESVYPSAKELSSQPLKNVFSDELSYVPNKLSQDSDWLHKQTAFLNSQAWFVSCFTCAPSNYLAVVSFLETAEEKPFRHYLVPVSSASFALVLYGDPEIENFLERGISWLKSTEDCLQQRCLPVKIAAGRLTAGAEEFLSAYYSVLECSDYFFSHEKLSFLTPEQIHPQPDDLSRINQQITEILSYAEQANYQRTDEALASLEAFFSSAWVKTVQIQTAVINLYLLASRMLAQKKKQAPPGLTAEQLLTINQAPSLSALFALTRKFYKYCIDCLNNATSTVSHRLAQDCLAFIQQHYAENINLAQAASSVHANPDYLSRILKKEYDLPFGQLLTNCRLEKSCSLLSDPNLSITEIAFLSGFNDFRYFGQVFKTRYKMTPRDYRKYLKTAGQGNPIL